MPVVLQSYPPRAQAMSCQMCFRLLSKPMASGLCLDCFVHQHNAIVRSSAVQSPAWGLAASASAPVVAPAWQDPQTQPQPYATVVLQPMPLGAQHLAQQCNPLMQPSPHILAPYPACVRVHGAVGTGEGVEAAQAAAVEPLLRVRRRLRSVSEGSSVWVRKRQCKEQRIGQAAVPPRCADCSAPPAAESAMRAKVLRAFAAQTPRQCDRACAPVARR